MERVGKKLWFEYHCYESPKSVDADLWYHSHQQILVLSISDEGGGETLEERIAEGYPRTYKVQFEDGFVGDAFEDELMESKDNFTRPAPIKMNAYQSTLKGFTSLLKVTLEKIDGMPEYAWQASMIKSHIEINKGLLELDLSEEQVLEAEPALKKAIGSFLKFTTILLDDTVENTLHILFSANPI